MQSLQKMDIEPNRPLDRNMLKPVKHFLVEFDSEPIKIHKFILFIKEYEIVRTRTLEYNNTYQMYEIKFFSDIYIMDTRIPDTCRDVLPLHLITQDDVMIYTKNLCRLSIVYYSDFDNILTQETANSNMVYIKYMDPVYTVLNNVLNFMGGSGGPWGTTRINYFNQPVTDLCHRIGL